MNKLNRFNCQALRLLFLLAIPLACYAQGSAILIFPVLGPNGIPRAGATISVCNSPATGLPCTNFASIFSDQGLTVPISQSVTPLKTDGLGNCCVIGSSLVGVFATPGNYTYTVSGIGIIAPQGPYNTSASGSVTCSTACAGTGSNNVFTGNNTFSAANTFSANNTFSGNNNFTGTNTFTSLTFSGLQTFSAGIASTGSDNFANISGLRMGNSNKFTSVANIQADCSSAACPFLLTPAFTNTTTFSPLPANDFLLDVRQPQGKYGPMLIVGDIPPSGGNPVGYPPQSTGCGGSACDTGLDLQYTNFAAYRSFNLTGTTINTNYAPHFEFYYFTGNPTSGAGNKQIVNYYNSVETSRSVGDLSNVSDLKLGNNYLAIRAPGFTGTTEGIENDVFYRAAGTISSIQFATESICGVFDNIAANISGTSYCNPTQWDNNGSGAVGQEVMNDSRLSLQMTGGGTQGGIVGYCAFCVQTVTTGGTVTSNIIGWDRVGPGTVPTFSAGKYWLASVNQPGATGANVNNDWWQGGDFNNGHMTFAGDGGATATHIWFSQTSGGLRQKNGAAPASSTDGQPIMYSGAPTVVGSLPTCNASLQDQWRVVTDATAPTYNGALTGGGAVRVPVYCNGSAWSSH